MKRQEAYSVENIMCSELGKQNIRAKKIYRPFARSFYHYCNQNLFVFPFIFKFGKIPVRLKSPNLHKKVKLWRILVVVVVKRSHRTKYKHGTILPFFGLGFLSVFYSVRFVHYQANCFRPQYHSKNVAFRRNHWRQITLFPECLARH